MPLLHLISQTKTTKYIFLLLKSINLTHSVTL